MDILKYSIHYYSFIHSRDKYLLKPNIHATFRAPKIPREKKSSKEVWNMKEKARKAVCT